MKKHVGENYEAFTGGDILVTRQLTRFFNSLRLDKPKGYTLYYGISLH
jgi:hypothetical protein